MSQILNLNNLIVFFATAGLPLGITKLVSEYENEKKWDKIRSIFAQIYFLFTITSIILLVVSLFFSENISVLLFGEKQFYYLIIILAFSIPFSLYNLLFDAIVRGLKKFNLFSKLSILSSILSVVLAFFMVYYFGLYGAVFSLVAASLAATIIYFFNLSKFGGLKLRDFFNFNISFKENLSFLFKLGIASLVVGLADQMAFLVIRSEIIANLGIQANGIFQSIYSISMNYFSVLFLSLSAYLLPVLSEKKHPELINQELNSTLHLALLIIVPLIISIFVLREWIIVLLYSKEFLPGTDLLFYNFWGDFFKALSWILGAWLVPTSRIRIWFLFSLSYYVMFFLLFYLIFFHFNLGLKSIPISFSISYFVNFLINLFYIRRYNNFKFTSKNANLLFGSFTFLPIILLISNYSITLGYWLIIPSLMLWFKFYVSREEFNKFVLLVRSNFVK